MDDGLLRAENGSVAMNVGVIPRHYVALPASALSLNAKQMSRATVYVFKAMISY